jgi:hypothetical protein
MRDPNVDFRTPATRALEASMLKHNLRVKVIVYQRSEEKMTLPTVINFLTRLAMSRPVPYNAGHRKKAKVHLQ